MSGGSGSDTNVNLGGIDVVFGKKTFATTVSNGCTRCFHSGI